MALDAILFDLDGVIFDTRPTQVRAWTGVLERFGHSLPQDRVAAEVGRSPHRLVASLLGEQTERVHGEAIRHAQRVMLEACVTRDGMRPHQGAERLLRAVRDRGLRAIGLGGGLSVPAEWRSRFDEVFEPAEGADVTRRLHDAITRTGCSPAQLALVTDTTHEISAARTTGLVTLAVRTAGTPADVLRSAGARATYADPVHLTDTLDDALRVASPGQARLTWDQLHRLMDAALEQAQAGMNAGEAPIGCVLATGDAEIIQGGFNTMAATGCKTAHAEMVVFARAAGNVPIDARDLILVSTLEPCVMCTGAAMEAAVDTILYALTAPADSGTTRVTPPLSPESQMPRIVGHVRRNESRRLFETWMRHHGHTQQAAYIRQLLELNSS